jgi:hypothetical protein
VLWIQARVHAQVVVVQCLQLLNVERFQIVTER